MGALKFHKRDQPRVKQVSAREREQEGMRLANALEEVTSLKETAKALGISWQAVRRIECLALYKIKAKLTEERINTRISHE